MKWAIYCLVLAMIPFAPISMPTRAQEPEQQGIDPGKRKEWMQKKLQMSQNILAALTEEDYTKIGLNAGAMNFIGYLEKWDKRDSPEYKQQLGYFSFATRELIRQSKEKNLDGATLAYNQLVLSCVQCHKIVRSASSK